MIKDVVSFSNEVTSVDKYIVFGVINGTWETVGIDLSTMPDFSAINDLQKDKQFRALNAENNKKMITTIRDGKQTLVSVDDLVVGDIVLIIVYLINRYF